MGKKTEARGNCHRDKQMVNMAKPIFSLNKVSANAKVMPVSIKKTEITPCLSPVESPRVLQYTNTTVLFGCFSFIIYPTQTSINYIMLTNMKADRKSGKEKETAMTKKKKTISLFVFNLSLSPKVKKI